MRLLFISDLQLGGGEAYGTPARSRLDDSRDALDAVTDIAAEREADLVIVAGDVFQHRRPAVDELLVFSRFLSNLPCPYQLVAGNHDLRGPASMPSVLDLFGRRGDTVHVYPAIAIDDELEGVAVAVLPWAHQGPLRASQAGVTPLEQAEALVRVAGDLFDAITVPGPRLLVTHHALSGFGLPGGLTTGDLVGEPVLDTQALLRQGWSAVIAGHIHQHGLVARDDHEPGIAVSLGSPWVQDFGEADGSHGVVLFDADTDTFDRLELPGRRFVTLDIDADDIGERVPYLGAEDVEGAVVRVRVHATAEQAGRFDAAAIRAQLEHELAHKVHAVTLDVVRTVRARAEGMAEDVGPLEALDSWLAATNAAPREAGRLRELTRDLLDKEG